MSLDIAKTHYFALRKYLASHLIKEKLGISAQRQSARDKLVRLTQQQFQELSTDVYDELCRRLMNSPTEYHPKRNQARQKLATLPKSRFKDLASDVFAELSRRYPQFAKEWEATNPEGGEEGGPLTPMSPGGESAASSSASGPLNTLPPRKAPPIPRPPNSSGSASGQRINDAPPAPFLEDSPPSSYKKPFGKDDSVPIPQPSPHPHETVIIPMQAQAVLVAPGVEEGLSYTVHDGRGGEVEYGRGLEKGDSSGMGGVSGKGNAAYEKEIRLLKDRVRELEASLEGVDSGSGQIQELKRRLRDQEEIHRDLEERFNELKQDYRDLQHEHRQCAHKYANGASTSSAPPGKDTTALLETIEDLVQRNEELEEFRATVDDKLTTMNDENRRLKRELEEARREIRALRGSSAYVRDHPKAEFEEDSGLLEPAVGGLLDIRHITGYQLAVDTLLQAAKSETPTRVLMVMKDVVINCKDMTAVMESLEADASEDPDFLEQVDLLKSQLSQSLSQLVTAAKSHATGFGISPLGTIESAVMVLTEVVVEIVRLLRIRPGGENGANGRYANGKLNRRSASDSTVESHQQPSTAYSKLDKLSRRDIDELKTYLEQRADAIVQAIQDLLTAMRSPTADAEELVETLGSINDIVRNLVKHVRRMLVSDAGREYRHEGEDILRRLETSNGNLERLKEQFPLQGRVDTSGADGKTPAKQDLAAASFEVAKYTKELIALVD